MDTIDLKLVDFEGQLVERLADKLIAECLNGNMKAFQLLMDRTDPTKGDSLTINNGVDPAAILAGLRRLPLIRNGNGIK